MRAARWLPLAIGLAGLAFLTRRLIAGITWPPLSDEAMHITGARVILAGGRLYRDFIDLHGPLTFAILQAFGAIAGWQHPNAARAIWAVLAAAAVAAIAASPIHRRATPRVLAAGLFAGLLAVGWLRQALYMLSFYPLGGLLAVVPLALFTVPLCRGASVGRLHAALAGAGLVLLAATSYSFAPTALLVGLAGLIAAWREGQRAAISALIAAAALTLVLTLVWLLVFADIGGYLAYHIGESQTVYPRYIGFGFHQFAQSLWPRLDPAARIQALAVIEAFAALVMLLILDARFPVSARRRAPEIILAWLGILALNARGMAILQNGAFVVASAAACALAGAELLARAVPRRPFAAAALAAAALIAVEAAGRGALTTPFGQREKIVARLHWPLWRRSDAAPYRRIRALVPPDQRILALIYAPHIYLLADRLPMSGFYTWFPWDADYAHTPRAGAHRDLCAALQRDPPPVIIYDHQYIWGYDPHRYMQCVFDFLSVRYRLDTERPEGYDLFVRRE